MRIFLLGMMGSGKSSIGEKVASRLNFEFVDSDKKIESLEGSSIRSIFEQNSEKYFRKLERKFLHQIIKYKKIVVATGGGMPCFDDNMNFMNHNGITVFLDVTIPGIIRRLSRKDFENRPLLTADGHVGGIVKSNLYDYLVKMREDRLRFYSMAQIKISGDSITFEDIINKLAF